MKHYYAADLNPTTVDEDAKPSYRGPKLRLGRVYVIPQPYVGMLPLDKALDIGTVFPNLYNEFPSLFYGEQSKKKREGEK